MRILLVLRLYTGFEAALQAGHFAVSGTPAIANLIRGLADAGQRLRIVFARRAGPARWHLDRDVEVTLPDVPARITVLAGEERLASLPGVIRRRAAYWRHLWPIARAWASFAPDVVYVDRGHLLAAALLARFTRTPVVWRVLGVPESLREVIDWPGLRGRFWRWLLRSPFAAVICTIDGSGGRAWLERALRPSVPRHFLLSGRPQPVSSASAPPLPSGRTLVVFLGRLEDLKGCDEFLAAFILAAQAVPGALHAVMVGGGSLAGSLQLRARDSGLADQVTFTGPVEHATALAIVSRADIYVSLNRMGNLSNANLEALAAGVCIVLPTSDPENGIDSDTEELVPADVALRFGKVDDVAALAAAIIRLHGDPHERAARGAKAKALAKAELVPWDVRIRREMKILADVASRAALRGPAEALGESRNRTLS